MSTPGFAAEFSLYYSDKSYRLTAGTKPYSVRPMVMPQKITCGEYECGEFWEGVPAYCMRCESDYLK
jgi:hypothetical protein